MAEGRWVTLLTRQMVMPARDREEHEQVVFGEGKPGQVDDGGKRNESEVDRSEHTDEAGG